MSARSALYRHFDADGRLLYVGIATDPYARADQHRHRSRWHRFSARMEVEWREDRESAERAEAAAIVSEEPVFNRSHARGHGTRAAEYLLDQIERSNPKPEPLSHERISDGSCCPEHKQLDDHVRRALASAPPVSLESRERIARLLSGASA